MKRLSLALLLLSGIILLVWRFPDAFRDTKLSELQAENVQLKAQRQQQRERCEQQRQYAGELALGNPIGSDLLKPGEYRVVALVNRTCSTVIAQWAGDSFDPCPARFVRLSSEITVNNKVEVGSTFSVQKRWPPLKERKTP